MVEPQGQVVYSDVAEGSNVRGKLFDDLKFWIAQRCPARNRFIEDVRANGGEIVLLEKNADYLIVDHARKDTPPGGISYRFIEDSIKKGELEDPLEYAAGAPVASVREVGSLMPKRRGRQPFTREDDMVLYKWIDDFERKGGKYISGNEVYKQLEQKVGTSSAHEARPGLITAESSPYVAVLERSVD